MIQMTKPRIALIIGSTRARRWADIPAEWMLKQMQARDDIDVELVDLRDVDLPFFNEDGPLGFFPAKDPKVLAWQARLATFDGFVFVIAEYNRGLSGSMKNALDCAYAEWNRKPMGSLGYGSVGAAFATAGLRLSAIELQMVVVRSAVHISGSDFFRVSAFNPKPEPMDAIEQNLLPGVKTMLDEIVWWANATKAARG